MDIRIEHAERSITNFLEDDFSSLLSEPSTLLHLERFRSFLHGFYVAKYGYWPPMKQKNGTHAFPKTLYMSMYFEFRRLYEYLVDPHASETTTDTKFGSGSGILQIIKEFDKRSKYSPLPQRVPLSPEVSGSLCKKPQGFTKLFERKQNKLDRRLAVVSALTAATNPVDLSNLDCTLVREYLRFEKSCALDEEDKISCVDARKVRWILIYGILQTLISVTRAPVAVQDTEGVSYPLCCQTAGTPPWQVPRAPTKLEPQPPTDRPGATKPRTQQEEATFYYFSKSSVSFSSLNNKPPRTTTTITPGEEKESPISTPQADRRPQSRRRVDLIQNYFVPQALNPTTAKKACPAPSIASFPSAPSSRFSISSVTVPLRSPQPQKPGFTEALLNLDFGDSELSPPEETSMRESSAFSAASSSPSSSPASSSSDPSTPSAGTEHGEEGDAWSVKEDGSSEEDTMDHHSVDDATSFYEDGADGEGAEAAAHGQSGQKTAWGEVMARNGSVRSDLRLDRCNPEVEMYFGSG